MVYKDFNIKKYTTKPIFSEIFINISFIVFFKIGNYILLKYKSI